MMAAKQRDPAHDRDDALVARDLILDGILASEEQKHRDARVFIRGVVRRAIAAVRADHPRRAHVRGFVTRGWTAKSAITPVRGFVLGAFERQYLCMFCAANVHTLGHGTQIRRETIDRIECHTFACACAYLIGRVA